MSSVQIAPVVTVALKSESSLSLDHDDYDIASRHACLVAEYADYMVAAGYSTGDYMLKKKKKRRPKLSAVLP